MNRSGAFCGALALAAVGCGDSPVSPTPGNQGSWDTLAPMPAARQELASAVLNGLIYVIGGYDSAGQSTNSVFVYNPSANTWSTAAPLPIVNNHGAAAVANGRLFAFGGVSNRAFVYNPGANSWSEVASMNVEHGNTAAVAVINNRIYVAGGTGGTQREVEAYDAIGNTWTLLAPMNVGRNHCAGGAIGGRFYVVGGRGFGDSDVAVEVYDPAANNWTSLTPMPTGRSGIGAGVVNNRLYVFGGEIPSIHNESRIVRPGGEHVAAAFAHADAQARHLGVGHREHDLPARWRNGSGPGCDRQHGVVHRPLTCSMILVSSPV